MLSVFKDGNKNTSGWFKSYLFCAIEYKFSYRLACTIILIVMYVYGVVVILYDTADQKINDKLYMLQWRAWYW